MSVRNIRDEILRMRQEVDALERVEKQRERVLLEEGYAADQGLTIHRINKCLTAQATVVSAMMDSSGIEPSTAPKEERPPTPPPRQRREGVPPPEPPSRSRRPQPKQGSAKVGDGELLPEATIALHNLQRVREKMEDDDKKAVERLRTTQQQQPLERRNYNSSVSKPYAGSVPCPNGPVQIQYRNIAGVVVRLRPGGGFSETATLLDILLEILRVEVLANPDNYTVATAGGPGRTVYTREEAAKTTLESVGLAPRGMVMLVKCM